MEVIDFLTDIDAYKTDFDRLSEFFEKADLAKKINGFVQAAALKRLKQ